MPIRIIGYHRARDIEEDLSSSGSKSGLVPIFLVPSSGDREILRDIILESVSFGAGEPSILRWDDLYREVMRELDLPPDERRRQIDPPDHWLIVRHVLENSRAENDCADLPPGALKRGFIWTLGENLRELLREEVLPDTLGASLGCPSCDPSGKCPRMSTPHGLLCRLYHDYLSYMESHSLADSAQTATITRIALSSHFEKASKWIRQHHFIFAGFMSFTRSQSGLIREISNQGASVTIFMPETGLDIHTAREQFEKMSAPGARPAISPIKVLLLSAGDFRLELETVVRNLSLWVSGKGEFARRMGIPFPGWTCIGLSADYERLEITEEILNRYRVPYVASGGPKVSQTPLWQTAAAALEAKRLGFPTEETSHILSQPWISPDGFPLLKALSQGPRGVIEWKAFLEVHGDKVLSDNFERIADFCALVQSGGSPSELLRSLRSVAGNGEVSIWGAALSRFVMSDPGLDESARRLNAASRELVGKLESVSDMEKDIGPAGSVTLRGAEASTFLATWAERSTVWQAPKSQESLSLYAGSPPVLARHPVFIVTGLTADAWPGRLRESPLLDDQRKEALHRDPGIGLSPVHLPLLREKRMQREALLRRIIASADDLCILSRPRQDGSGRPLLPSMMLEAAASGDNPWITLTGGDPPFARSVKDVLPSGGETVISDIEIRENDHPRMPGRLSSLPPPTPWPVGVAQRASMSSIDTWLECPFKFYAGRILGLGKTWACGFDPLAAGTMIHALWEKVWTERLSSGADLFCLAERCWEETVHEQYPDLEKLPRHLGRLREETLKMAHLQQDMENSGLALARTGQKREEKVSLTVEGIPFSGRYDRLDILQDGTALLFDYKTGRGNGLSRSLQLAAYAAALRETGSIEISGCIFLSQRDNGVTAILEGNAAGILGKWIKKNQTKLEDMIETAKKVMGDMALSISESRFIPNYENTQACMFCDFHGLCRKSESTGRGSGEDDGNDD